MERICLTEYQKSAPIRLTHEDVVALRQIVRSVQIEPALEEDGAVVLTPGSNIGVVVLPNVVLEIRPKIPIDRLFFLLSYAVDPKSWRHELVDLDADDSVLEAVAPAFVHLVARTTYRGLLHGYKTFEESSVVLRGRLRTSDQIRQRAGVMFPLEVRYDEFTEDIIENQVLLAALELLMRLPLRSASTARSLREVRAAFHAVTPVEFRGSHLPDISFTRLNEHYRPAIELAMLILRGSSLELGMGQSTGIGLLLDMNELFELFVHRALMESLGVDSRAFPRGDGRLKLDQARQVTLQPDLSWWIQGECRFVGDVKYKRISAPGIKHPDLYQLLAYTVASHLDEGLLIYASGEGEPARHVVPFADKQLHVESLDLAGSIDDIRSQIDHLAQRIRGMAVGAQLV